MFIEDYKSKTKDELITYKNNLFELINNTCSGITGTELMETKIYCECMSIDAYLYETYGF